MSTAFIARDSSAANLRSARLKIARSSLTSEELLREALGISKATATTLLTQLGGGLERPLKALTQADPNLLHQLGLSEKQASRATAIAELSKRMYAPQYDSLPLESPEAVAAYLWYDLATEPVERFGVLMLDVKNRPIGRRVITQGTATETLAHPREIFRWAAQAGATRLIIAHNHPSGSVDPSPEDLALTEQLLQGSQILGIPLLDHLILSSHCHQSLRQTTDLWEQYPQGL